MVCRSCRSVMRGAVARARAGCWTSCVRTMSMSASMRSNCWAAVCLPGPGRRRPGPERRYEGIEPVVRQIWLTAEQPCGKRLVPILRQWLPYYERRFGRLSRRAAQVGAASQRGHLGSVAGAGAGRTCGAGPVRDQTGESVALGNSDSHGHLGSEPAGLFGGRQRGPLRREPGWGFHLEPDLYGHFKRLDRRRGGVEQGGRRRAGGHPGGGGALALRACWDSIRTTAGNFSIIICGPT